MTYNFKCRKCGRTKAITTQPNEIKGLTVECECGSEMTRDWSCALQVNEAFKTDNAQDMNWVRETLKTRPSGRDKVYY